MHTIYRNTLAIAAMALLTGCGSSGGSYGNDSYSMRTAPERDERACLDYVAGPNGANNRQVSVISSETSEANNMVTIAVGDQRAPWNCLVKDGRVDEVYYAGGSG